jgi:hypothetical protein
VVPRPPQACKKVCRKAKAEDSNVEHLPLSVAQPKPTNGRPNRTSPAEAASTVRLDASVITVRRWERLAEGALYAATSRIDWATLLRRTFGFDALVCPRCQGRLRVLATIVDTEVARRIVGYLAKGIARAPPSPPIAPS